MVPAPAAASSPASAAAPVAAERPAPPPAVQVKTGYIGTSVSNAGIFIAAERGYFQEEGLTTDLIAFDGGVRMVPALATDELQVGAGAAGAGLFNTVHRGVRSLVVADKGSGPPGAGWLALIVRKDLYDSGALTRLEDLRGKTVGVFTYDSTHEIELALHVAPYGMTLADMDVVEASLGDQPAMLANRRLDATWTIEPMVTVLADRGLAVRLLSADERRPNFQNATIMYSEQFAARRDPATRWMVAYLHGVRDYNDAFVKGQGREEVLRILEKVGVVMDRGQLDRMGHTGLNPNGYVNRQYLQEMHDFFLRKGSITQPVPLSDLVDDSFVTAALARLGPYDNPMFRDAVWSR
jgi:NitT/TauT family transport system substrate-binding protein